MKTDQDGGAVAFCDKAIAQPYERRSMLRFSPLPLSTTDTALSPILAIGQKFDALHRAYWSERERLSMVRPKVHAAFDAASPAELKLQDGDADLFRAAGIGPFDPKFFECGKIDLMVVDELEASDDLSALTPEMQDRWSEIIAARNEWLAACEQIERDYNFKDCHEGAMLDPLVAQLDSIVGEAVNLVATDRDELIVKATMAQWMSDKHDLMESTQRADPVDQIVWSIARDLLDSNLSAASALRI